MAGQLLSFPASPQDNQNTTAFNSLPDPFQDRLEQIVKTTPDVVSHPEILYGLAQQNGINGYTLGMALNHLATTGTNSVALSDYAASQRQSHGPGILGDIGSFVSGIPNDVSQVAQGAYHSGAGMVEGLYRSQISPLLQSSYWTPQNLKYQFSDQALEHETLAAGKSVAQSFFRIAHMQAFLTSMAHRHGWAYTIGTFLPSIALGAATGGAFAPAGVEAGLAAGTEGVGIGAEAAATAADTAGAEAAASAGTEAATTEASDVLSLVKSMAKKIPKGQDLTPEEQQLWDSGEFTRLVSTGAARGVLHNISERTLEILGAPVGLAMRGIGAARGYLGGPIGAQVRYFSMQAAAQNDPQTAALWDATANGSVYDANGNRVGSAGEAFATYLGLTPNDMLFAPVAGLDDFYGHWLGVDPLGAVGHTLAISRSAGGFAANTIMGRWFNGIGLHAPEDVWNVYQRQSQMRRAVQYMATHNAADINRTFKGFFTGSEAAKVMLRDIGKATTHQQVLDILAAKVGTDAMTRRIAPMLSFKSRLWATMAIGHGVQVAAENFLSDTYEQIEAHRAEFFAKTGMNPIAHTATEVATRDGGLRARAALGRFLRRRIADLSPRPMALDTEVLDYNNRRFRFGDLNAIPAIGNNARAMGLFSHLDISLFEDALTHASPEEWNNLIESHYATMAEGALRAAGNANSDGAISLALAEFKAQLRFYQGPDGGGREATAYTAGEAGGRYDLVASADRPDDPRRAGFALNHLGQGQYFDPRQIRQLVKRLQIGLVDGTTNFDLRGMQYLEGDSVEQLAKARNATLDSVRGEVQKKIDRWESRLTKTEVVSTHSEVIPAAELYHGRPTSLNRTQLNPDRYGGGSSSNLFGPGFYTTDNAEIARSYTGKGSRGVAREGTLNKNVYGLHWRGEGEPKLLDLEQPAPQELRDAIRFALRDEVGLSHEYMDAELADPNITGAALYKAFKDNLIYEGVTRDTADEAAHDVTDKIEEAGYDGFRYQGGNYATRGKGQLHEVRIFFDPSKLEIDSSTQIGREATTRTVSAISPIARQSYDTTREGIDNVLKAYRETAELKASQQFAGFHDFISTSLHASEMQLQQAREELVRNAVEDSLSAQIAANETVERLQGQVTALTHYADEINQRIASPTMSSADIKRLADQHAADIAAGGGLDKVAEKKIADALHNRLIDVRDKKLRVWDPGSWNAGFYNWHQHMVNFLNKTLSETFVPMALFSGGWAIRVASSELLLNAMRIGGWNAFNSQMVYYIAKHEVRGTALSDLEKQWVHKDVSQIFIGMRYYAHALKKGVRDILGGALEGIERNLLKNMSKAERDRFLEDAVALRIRHGRDLPGGIHGAKDIAQMDRFGMAKWRRDSTVEAFTHHMGLHANDQLSNPVFRDIQQWIRDNPTRSYEAEGSNSLLSEAEQSQLFDHLSNKAYDRLLTTSPEELSRFGRDDMRLWDETLRAPKGSRLDNAKGDHARTLAYNAMHSVMGHGNKGGVIWHSLVDQVADNNIEPTIQLAAQLDAMGEAIPKHVPVADALKIDGIKSLLSPHLIQMASDYGHEKVLGPIVNQLVRGPLFTYEYHVAMEAEREFVDKGLLTLDQAEVRAEVAAIINLKKYVHNPMERTNLENNMRVLAPFYFAQNQAWRRALRVLESDPGAFERYLKVCLAATSWIGAHKVQGKDSFSIPGTNWLGARAGSLFGQGPVPFDFSGSIGSVQSVVPTGAEAGTGILSDIARPSWGPLVTWPVQQVDRYFGTPEADKLAEGFLGPIAFRSGAFGEALPSTSLRGVLGAIWYQEGWGNGPTQTVMLQAQAATMEQKYTQWQQEATAEYEKIVKGGTAPLSVDARAAWIQGETLSIGSQWMSDPTNKNEFLHDMKEVAVAMMLIRSVLSFGSPVSLQIQEKFTKNAEFQKILNGLPKGEQNFITAADIFNAKFPNHLFDLVSHSKTLYSPYPETTTFTNIYDKWRTGLTKYPFATAYLIPQGGTYDPTANGRQLAMNLRAVDTPSEFYDAMQKALGNQWFYSYLTPIMAKQYPDGRGGVNSTGYGLMTTYAKQYGNNENPLWYQSFASGGAKADKIAALKQMNELLGDKSVPASVLSNKDRQTFVMLMHQYGNAVYEYDQLKAAGDSSTASLIYEQWYQQCQEAATLPQYARQSFFLTSVLATLPTRQ